VTSPFISVSELAEQLASATPPTVLDASFVLHPAAFDGDYRTDNGRPRWLDSHIPGSMHIDVTSELSDLDSPLHYAHPDPQEIANLLASRGVAEGDRVVVYDTTGTLFAARVWYLLRWIGVPVRVLDGGLKAWIAAGEPVRSGEERAPEAVSSWRASARRNYWVSADELAERGASDDRSLVCGLPAGSFTGADPSRYARRGRIPGSVNVSSRDLFESDGTVKSRVELILAYDRAGVAVGEGKPEVLLYCGGGISAAANALTLDAIGMHAVRIYDGSLEEWSADPERPLDVG
jgi:thiosulfate/3-mercaptopyruvate sulfurtransferase